MSFSKTTNNKYINVKEGPLTMQVGDFFICSSLKHSKELGGVK